MRAFNGRLEPETYYDEERNFKGGGKPEIWEGQRSRRPLCMKISDDKFSVSREGPTRNSRTKGTKGESKKIETR